MKNFPAKLATKEDYLAVMALFDREVWEPYVSRLLSTVSVWECSGKATKKSKEDSTHKVEAGMAYELKEVENPKLAELSLTREEVAGWLV